MTNKEKLEESTIKAILQENLLLEFANIQKQDYNTPVGLWIDELGNKRNIKHNEPRIKLVNNYNEDFTDLIDITIIEQEVQDKDNLKISNKDLKKMKQFIAKNKQIFLDRYNNLISTKEMFNQLDENN